MLELIVGVLGGLVLLEGLWLIMLSQSVVALGKLSIVMSKNQNELMSADNWAQCPRCQINLTRYRDKAIAEAKAIYGEASAMKVAHRIPEEVDTSLREEYEMGISDNGNFYSTYNANCQQCGLEFHHHHDESVRNALAVIDDFKPDNNEH